MKTLFLSALLTILMSTGGLSQSFNAETTAVDSFLLIESGRTRLIEPANFARTSYGFTVSNPESCQIRLICKGCKNKLSIRFLDQNQKAETPYFYFDTAETISLSACMEQGKIRKESESLFERILRFISESAIGRTSPGRSTTTKADGETKSASPNLTFLQTDSTQFVRRDSLRIHMKLKEGCIIKNIVCTGDGENDRLWVAGENELVNKHFKDEVIQKADLTKAIRKMPGIDVWEVNHEYLQTTQIRPFKARNWYQLRVELEGDSSSNKAYIFTFAFFTEEELKKLMPSVPKKKD